MCSDSSRLRRSAALVAAVLFVAGCIAAAGAQPAANRAEAAAAANSADNGLRQQSSSTRSSRTGRQSHRVAQDEYKYYCGSELRNMLANLCRGRGYNGISSPAAGTDYRGARSGGAANDCCKKACTMKDLDSYCNPRTGPEPDTEADSVVVESVETVGPFE